MNIGDTVWVAWDDSAAPLRRAQPQSVVVRQPGQSTGVVIQDQPAYEPAQVTTWIDNLTVAQATTIRRACEKLHDDAAVVPVLDSRGRVWTCRVLAAVVDVFDVPGNTQSLRCVWLLYPQAGPT